MSTSARVRPMVMDDGTSTDAAALHTRESTERARGVIMSLFAEHGAMTDDQLVDRYRARAHAYTSVPLITPQRIRTHRSLLTVEGHLRVTGEAGRSALGNRASVWALA